eukprot:g5392.t1
MSLSGLVGGYGSDSSDSAPSAGDDDVGQRSEGHDGGGSGKERKTTAGAVNARAGVGNDKRKGPQKTTNKNADSSSSRSDSDSDSSSEDSSDKEDDAAAPGGVGGRKTGANKRIPFQGGAAGKTATLLPSVDDLFSSTAGPDFLTAPGGGEDFVVKATKKEKKKQAAGGSSSTSATGTGAAAAAAAAKRERGIAEGVGSAAAVGVKKPKGGAVGPAGPPVDRKKVGGKDKMSAKDKVKGQRLKGQSGIGSDFRTWKSDLEMTMRQEYD